MFSYSLVILKFNRIPIYSTFKNGFRMGFSGAILNFPKKSRFSLTTKGFIPIIPKVHPFFSSLF